MNKNTRDILIFAGLGIAGYFFYKKVIQPTGEAAAAVGQGSEKIILATTDVLKEIKESIQLPGQIIKEIQKETERIIYDAGASAYLPIQFADVILQPSPTGQPPIPGIYIGGNEFGSGYAVLQTYPSEPEYRGANEWGFGEAILRTTPAEVQKKEITPINIADLPKQLGGMSNLPIGAQGGAAYMPFGNITPSNSAPPAPPPDLAVQEVLFNAGLAYGAGTAHAPEYAPIVAAISQPTAASAPAPAFQAQPVSITPSAPIVAEDMASRIARGLI